MKILLASISFFCAGALSAQKIKVAESNEHIGGNKNPAFVVSIYDASAGEIESKWKSLMKDYKGKMSSSDGVFADNAVISSINGNNSIDVYAKTEKVKEGETKLIVAFDLGGAFLSSSNNKEKFNQAKKVVNDFAVKTTKEAIAGQKKAEEKKLDKLNEEQRDLEKSQEKLNSNIEDYNKRIKEAQEGISKNKTDQEKKKAEVEAQKKAVEAVTAKESAVE